MPIAIPPRRILVPVDFSPASLEALAFARHLAPVFSASIEALHVYEILYSPEPPSAPTVLSEETRRLLTEDLRRRAGPEARATVVPGVAEERILELARERGAELIVMGTSGRTGLPRVVLGSTAERVVRDAPAPVLTVRRSWAPVRRVLAPIDFTPCSLRGLLAAAGVAQALDARLDALFVAQGPYTATLLDLAFRAALDRLPPYFRTRRPELLVREGDPAKAVIQNGKDYDLICLVSRRKRMFEDIVLGTTAERVLRHSPTPVLCLPHAVGDEAPAEREALLQEAAQDWDS